MSFICGLYYIHEYRRVSLPLLGVQAEASIKELAAQVKLTQTYGNDATFPIEAKYTFPCPARAAVTSFVMIKQDGTRIVGSVKEKQEAKEAYDAAVEEGQQASLMDQQSADVFEVSVGNIPSKEQVQIELVYSTELSEDEDTDSIRFHLPVHIGARYGDPPKSPPKPFPFHRNVLIAPNSPTPFLTLAMSVEAIAPIAKIGCSSHSVSTELGPDPNLPNFKELPFSNYARVSLSSDSPLDKDFVLTIKSAGLDTPRCVAELHPTHDTAALGLTLVPRFKLPDLSRQEFVFMVDRSGSMGGQRIAAARKALIIMLRALPHQDSLFQILSFGSRASTLWADGSRPYNQETLEEATRHVDSMNADYGGTEIRAALKHCFDARKKDRPMSVLVLTDGDAWDVDGVLEEVKSAVAGGTKDAYVRVSVLGIGNSASTAMCEGMARVGNGTCMMVGEDESSFTGKIARMLKAARTPPISDISVDWGRKESKTTKETGAVDDDDFEIVEDAPSSEKPAEKKTLNIFDESVTDSMDVGQKPAPPAAPVVLPDFAEVQQAPYKIQNLFPNIRLNIYAILQGKTIPQTVTIRGTTADGASIELPVPVTLSHLQNTPDAPPALHALAARKIIQDLEDGKHALKESLAKPDDSDLLKRTVKASIVRLGTTYSIVSTHTSFVAIDETKPDKPPVQAVYITGVPVGGGGARHRLQPAMRFAASAGGPPRPMVAMRAKALVNGMNSGPGGGGFSGGPTPGAAPPPLGPRGGVTGMRGGAGPFRMAAPAAQQQSAPMPSMAAAPAPTVSSFGARERDRERAAPMGYSSSPAPQMQMAQRSLSAAAQPPPPLAQTPSADPLEALARLQSFNGCFSLQVLTVVKLKSDIQAVRDVFPQGVSDEVLATVLAMAFLSTKLGKGVERDSWEGIYEKAQQYVEGELAKMGVGEGVNALESKVIGLLA
ncbi:von Willebrand factor type A domain-containing protein [Favolaschia claudopus]|uniref:von Willebrand factor type A domain-containing protein n=1 Tax=Favolaschia claudopus TaxID=2862362 RepID=A0AAW0DQL0_9AGAR